MLQSKLKFKRVTTNSVAISPPKVSCKIQNDRAISFFIEKSF